MGNSVETVQVWNDAETDPFSKKVAAARVWWDGRTARCCNCDGTRVGMRSNCKHARAVKRIRTREDS